MNCVLALLLAALPTTQTAPSTRAPLPTPATQDPAPPVVEPTALPTVLVTKLEVELKVDGPSMGVTQRVTISNPVDFLVPEVMSSARLEGA